MKQYIKWGMIGVIAIGFVGWGIYHLSPKVNKEISEVPVAKKGRPNKTLNVKAIILKEKRLSDQFSVSGNILPDEEVDLSFETAGKITDIFFQEGTAVNEGELLAKINDAPLQAELKKLEAQLKLNRDRLHRQNILLEKEAVSQEAFQEAETNLATLQADIDRVKARIEQTELRAPFDGIIGLRQVSQGAYASPTTTIARLTKTDVLKIEFSVPERYTGILKKGTALTFTVEGDMNAKVAKIYALDSHVDNDTRTFKVRALYNNDNGALFPGRYTSVQLTTRTFDKALSIPSEAIISEMGLDKVFVYHNGQAQPATITKGIRTASEVQILHGVQAGDTIITSGIMQLRTGQKVTIDGFKR